MKKLLLVALVLIGLQTQAQQPAPYFCCDSISYWTDQGQGLFVGLDTSGIVHNPDSMTVSWQVCNSDMCYIGDGMIPTSINELTLNKINDNKMYDLMGREVTKLNPGQMYIRNNKKYIRVK